MIPEFHNIFLMISHSEAEKKFFLNHEMFCLCDTRTWGVVQLSKKLTSLLVSRIQLQLLPMKLHVEKNLGEEVTILHDFLISLLCFF